MAAAVYIACALTALGCAVLLLNGYRKSQVPLLMWSAICFILLTISNVILVVDLLVVPDVDLFVWRQLFSLGGVAALLYGLIWEQS